MNNKITTSSIVGNFMFNFKSTNLGMLNKTKVSRHRNTL